MEMKDLVKPDGQPNLPSWGDTIKDHKTESFLKIGINSTLVAVILDSLHHNLTTKNPENLITSIVTNSELQQPTFIGLSVLGIAAVSYTLYNQIDHLRRKKFVEMVNECKTKIKL